jgi:hypothetical protein
MAPTESPPRLVRAEASTRSLPLLGLAALFSSLRSLMGSDAIRRYGAA